MGSRVEIERRSVRSESRSFGEEIQLRQNGLPQMLRASTTEGRELPQEEMRTHVSTSSQEKAEIETFYSILLLLRCRSRIVVRIGPDIRFSDTRLRCDRKNGHGAKKG